MNIIAETAQLLSITNEHTHREYFGTKWICFNPRTQAEFSFENNFLMKKE
jgi:hypothetical protein